MRVSVIVSTYENPAALELVLVALARQTMEPAEVLIADDGSGAATQDVIARYARAAPFPVRHVWQPDAGFRKCAILNRAVAASEGEYLVFLDGDCVPRRDFLAAHARMARWGQYLAGGKIFLTDSFSRTLTPAAIAEGLLERPGPWWWRHVVNPRRLVLGCVPGVRALLDRNLQRRWHWRGENSSTFAEHVCRVAGFDERFGYGFEDEDFGRRLEAAGIRGRSVRYRIAVFHLEHARPYARPEEMLRNRRLLEENRAARVAVTPHSSLLGPRCRIQSRGTG